jgi:parallel beta-helix repeat protein
VTPRWGSAVELANNIFDNNVVGIAADAASKGLVTLDNNCVHANGTDYEGIADVTGANGNIRADPLLADPAHNNFHIQPQSPCHDAGENGAVAPGETDIDGLARIIGSSVDIGADESDPRVWPIASPPVIRVSTTGSDTNDGSSWARAKRTVSNALRSAGVSAGEVWVAGGTYASGIVIPPNVGLLGGFSPRAGDRGRRDPASIVTVLAGSGVMFTGAGPASRVDGLVIRGGGVACSGGSPLISNCAITGCSGSGIDVRYGSTPHITGNQIAGNGLSNPSSKSGAGIYAWEASPVVANNIIRGNGGGGVQIMESEGTLVRDNLISSNGSEQYAAPGIAVWHGSLTATNNTVVGNKGLGLMVYSPDHQSVFVNNIVARNGAAVLAYADTFRNNDFTGPNLGLAESLIGRSGNISADPLFVDYASGDFHLKAGSPCIDTGDDSVIATWESDLDGRSRKGGPHVDMGCYEWLP